MKLAVLVDATQHSQRAFEEAIDHLNKDQDELYVITSVEYVPHAVPFGLKPFFELGYAETDQVNLKLRENSKAIIEGYKKYCQEHDITNAHFTVIASFEPKQDVCRYIEMKNIQVAFVGTRCLNRFQQFFLGSYSNYMVTHLPCSVMVVKHHTEAHDAHDTHAAITDQNQSQNLDQLQNVSQDQTQNQQE